MFKNFMLMLRDEDGATLVEYALIVSLIAIAAITALKTLATNVNTTLSSASNQLQ